MTFFEEKKGILEQLFFQISFIETFSGYLVQLLILQEFPDQYIILNSPTIIPEGRTVSTQQFHRPSNYSQFHGKQAHLHTLAT